MTISLLKHDKLMTQEVDLSQMNVLDFGFVISSFLLESSTRF
ncbi:hypothetical protein WNY51_06325 [Pseudocolwellia sp. AS88]|nr:hypothetical protein [Pseudocolwellia sp. AS88]MDO7083293.1 hypothetical protein [Pseudocolwellia sp. AS88]